MRGQGEGTSWRGARPTPAAAALDVAAVLAFVVLGRRSHAEGLDVAGVAGTSWPFLVGLTAGWAVARLARLRAGSLAGGLPVWAVTVTGGLALRAATGGGTAVSFAVVTATVLAVLLLGWRVVGRVSAGRRS